MLENRRPSLVFWIKVYTNSPRSCWRQECLSLVFWTTVYTNTMQVHAGEQKAYFGVLNNSLYEHNPTSCWRMKGPPGYSEKITSCILPKNNGCQPTTVRNSITYFNALLYGLPDESCWTDQNIREVRIYHSSHRNAPLTLCNIWSMCNSIYLVDLPFLITCIFLMFVQCLEYCRFGTTCIYVLLYPCSQTSLIRPCKVNVAW